MFICSFFFLQNGKASWIEHYKAIPRNTLCMRLYTVNDKKLAIIFNKTDRQEPIQQPPQPPTNSVMSPQPPLSTQSPALQDYQLQLQQRALATNNNNNNNNNTANSAIVTTARALSPEQAQNQSNANTLDQELSDTDDHEMIFPRSAEQMKVNNEEDVSECDCNMNSEDDNVDMSSIPPVPFVQLSETPIATKKRIILAWPFVHKVNEREDTDRNGVKKASVELLYIVAYYGYGRTQTEADANAAKSVLQKYGVQCEANNLAVSQLRSVISRTFCTTEFPILGSCKLGADSFQTKLCTLEKYTVEGTNFDEAYAKLEGKRGEIEAKIEDAHQGR